VSEKLPGERPSDVDKQKQATQGSDASPKLPLDRPPSGAFPKLYQDPGAQRGLPAPLAGRLHGGERVKLTKAQDYADRRVEAGAEGLAMYPSSQAACWVVLFLADGMMRVVPQWDLETVGPVKAHH
jgi:hypothetical protein